MPHNEDELKSEAESILDSVISGIEEKNYDKFILRFHQDLKSKFSLAKYNESFVKMFEQYGNYISRSFLGLVIQENQFFAVWRGKYSKYEYDAFIKLIFCRIDGKYFLSGIEFK